MRLGRAGWRAVELVVPCLLVMASTVLLASAVGAMLLGAPRDVQWNLFGQGVLCWGLGIAWGWLVNDKSSWLRRPW